MAGHHRGSYKRIPGPGEPECFPNSLHKITMSCLALDSPTMPDFRGRKRHRIPSAISRYCKTLVDERQNAGECASSNEADDLLCLYTNSNDSDFFDGTRTVLHDDQSFTLFEDHILIHNYQFPTMRIKRILYRNILDVSTDKDLAANWYSIKTWNFTLNVAKRPTTLVLTIRNKYKRVELSVRDRAAYSLLKRLVYEANNTPLVIE
ncbi:hypothetical protein K493DRAFT_371444 [Basidiobolus meristosporus CBS 931.73]|uniref:Uncharacterized protein n=1 Tax=Basidiobolus meristosporus CBS 931.73 TaxID=1314790 RepID=A0A1Y1YDQ0_9FUNG|nr:hypothetical protein K493DRAFT_371444 [Basidiobolus meristosporus CBS 931.73]|eukprot:ORX96043.1 hypothetical protein K493DRAFT_371444 [Basidiobolus meristosporus CBS 931.73]